MNKFYVIYPILMFIFGSVMLFIPGKEAEGSIWLVGSIIFGNMKKEGQ